MKANFTVSTRAVLGDLNVPKLLEQARTNASLAAGLLSALKKRIEAASLPAQTEQHVVVARDVKDVLHKLERYAAA